MRAFQFILLCSFAATCCALAATAQAVSISDPNLFSGKTVTAASTYSGAFLPANLTDGTTSTFVFADTSAPNALTISDFNSRIDTLRIFDWPNQSGTLRASGSVEIGYTSVNGSTNPADYTSLGTFTLPTDASGSQYLTPTSDNTGHYTELDNLGIPAGTQTLAFVFAYPINNGNPSTYGPALGEIQAFATPEPASVALLALGVVGLAAPGVRRRRGR